MQEEEEEEASRVEYILNIYNTFFVKVTDFKSALQKYCKHFIFFKLVGEKESTSICVMHTNANSTQKNK